MAADVYFRLQDALGRAPLMSEYQAALQNHDLEHVAKQLLSHFHAVVHQLLDFFADRLKVQQREAGVRHHRIDVVFALGGEADLVRLLARVKALQRYIATDDGANLLAGYMTLATVL